MGFYCSSGSSTVDKYVVYNYQQDIWYYGTLTRTAWLDSGLRQFPLAATYNNNLVEHENGVDDNETATLQLSQPTYPLLSLTLMTVTGLRLLGVYCLILRLTGLQWTILLPH